MRLTQIDSQISEQHRATWVAARAMRRYRPGHTLRQATAAVRDGRRLALYGWRADVVEQAALAAGLLYSAELELGYRDPAVAALWGWLQTLPQPLRHAGQGMLLGYPDAEIEAWVAAWEQSQP